MDLENTILKIKNGNQGYLRYLRRVLGFVLRFEIPAPKVIFQPLYTIINLYRFIFPLLMTKAIYGPVFKSRCIKYGKHITIVNKIPWIEGNLIIELGNNVTLDAVTFVSPRKLPKALLSIGDGSYIGYNSQISVSRKVTIGKNCLVSKNTFISDNNGHWLNPKKRMTGEALPDSETAPVSIGDNVWVATGAVILKGTTIGEGSIISANSVVTKDVPPNSIVMGVPAKKLIGGIDKLDK